MRIKEMEPRKCTIENRCNIAENLLQLNSPILKINDNSNGSNSQCIAIAIDRSASWLYRICYSIQHRYNLTFLKMMYHFFSFIMKHIDLVCDFRCALTEKLMIKFNDILLCVYCYVLPLITLTFSSYSVSAIIISLGNDWKHLW